MPDRIGKVCNPVFPLLRFRDTADRVLRERSGGAPTLVRHPQGTAS
jgi:hypothetical protein